MRLPGAGWRTMGNGESINRVSGLSDCSAAERGRPACYRGPVPATRRAPDPSIGKEHAMSTARRSVGFIGLGQMGFGMAANLLKAGHDVHAYDVAAGPLARFAALGGRAARNPAEIGAACESAMVMVVDGKQVDAVLSGSDGLLGTMKSGG